MPGETTTISDVNMKESDMADAISRHRRPRKPRQAGVVSSVPRMPRSALGIVLRETPAVRCWSGIHLFCGTMGPGSAEQRDRTMLRIAGRTLHRVRDTVTLQPI